MLYDCLKHVEWNEAHKRAVILTYGEALPVDVLRLISQFLLINRICRSILDEFP